MEIVVISIGKISTPWIKEGLKIYENRIGRYLKFKTIEIPDIKNPKILGIERIKEEEGKLILNEMSGSDIVVMMDEKGTSFSSLGFSEWIRKQMLTGKKRLLFVIGGPYGFSDNVYQHANFKIALSEMTFTHEMAKLFLTEQIYRAFTILNNEPYHHI